MMRVATGDLDQVHAKFVEKALKFGDIGDLETPTANAEAERGKRRRWRCGCGHDEILRLTEFP